MGKNIIIFDKDDEREDRFWVTKPDDSYKPKSEEEAKQMVVDDISTATEGLLKLVKIGQDSGYIDSVESAKLIVKYFTEKFIDNLEEKDK
jgi:hypothetical protein